MKVKELHISAKVTKSQRYQSGSGEFGVVVEVGDGECVADIYDIFKRDALMRANELADESLANATGV